MIASVQKIIDVRKADNADSLDVVKVLGWQVVTRMGEFKPGDTVVYVEIDSVLPELEVFEFMRNKDFRVKTAKFRGNLSQGIVFPITILPPGQYDIGVEVGTLLGITHYEKPIPVSMQGMMRGNLPFGLSKTDEERYQNVPDVIEEFQGKEVYITTKIDGTSSTFAMKDGDFHVCGRKIDYKPDVENVYWKIANKYGLGEKLQGYNMAVRGEIAGPGLQKNRLGLKDHELFVFDIVHLDTMRYLDYDEILYWCAKLDLQTPPLEYRGIFDFTLDELKTMSDGLYKDTKNLKEGIVIRTCEEQYSKALRGRSSFKVVSDTFLLENKE